MKIKQLLEAKKGVRAVKHTVKPRNFVAKNAMATTSGAGAHKDKKKASKQGYEKHKSKELNEATSNPDLMSQTDYDNWNQSQMDQQKRNFKRDELEHELGHEERDMYWVMVAKNGKWEYTKAQPKQQGMNAAMRLIGALHAKYPSMQLGMQWPNGQVENYGKGKK